MSSDSILVLNGKEEKDIAMLIKISRKAICADRADTNAYHCSLFKQYFMFVIFNQMTSGLFRFIAALGRNMIIASTFGSFSLLTLNALGGMILSRGIFCG